jgi:hypothetical protein
LPHSLVTELRRGSSLRLENPQTHPDHSKSKQDQRRGDNSHYNHYDVAAFHEASVTTSADSVQG